MKNIFKYTMLLAVLSFGMVSCDEETNYEELIGDVDPNATYYVQFTDAAQRLSSNVNDLGEIIDIETTVAVVLQGVPQSQDIVVDLAIDPSTTIDPSMYELSATSVTIPAGSTSGSVTLKTNTELMPIDETLDLVINLNAGEHNATAGTQLNYELYRIQFCTLDINEFVGSYTGSDANGNPTKVVTSLNASGQLQITGVAVGWMTGFWGEAISTQNTLPMDVNLVTGEFTIAEAPYMITTYNGAVQPAYNLVGKGRLDACTGNLFLDYDLIQGGSGLAGSYGPFQEDIFVN